MHANGPTRQPGPALLRAAARLDAPVFTTAQASARGVDVVTLGRLVGHGLLIRLRRGVYERASAASPAHSSADVLAARLASLSQPAVVAHRSAATFHGLRVPFQSWQIDGRLYVLRDPDLAQVRHSPETVVLPSTFTADHLVPGVCGSLVTTIARTALDLGRGCPLERALVSIDHALALGATVAELEALRGFMLGWPGTRVLRPAVAYADARSESGLESIVRGRMLASGLPEPDLQTPVSGESGAQYRADMCWLEQRVILEVDGRGKFALGQEAVIAEKVREDDLRAVGFTVVRIMYPQLADPKRRVLTRLARALDVPLQPYDPEWGQTRRWDAKAPRPRSDAY